VLALLASATPAALPPTDSNFETAHFSGSGACASCHNDLTDEQGHDVSLERDWATTMMANAARDPFWQAKVASEKRRNPQLSEAISHTCTRCHAPMANVTAEAYGEADDYLDQGTPDPTHPSYDLAMEGVSCTLCHQIEDNGLLGTPEGSSGNFSIDLSQRLAYGPKANPSVGQMQNWSGFTPLHGAHTSDSALCGTCHDLRTPTVDGDGEILEHNGHGFPEQMIYSEWENSAYAEGQPQEQSCQGCHMPETDGVKLATRPRTLPAEDDFSRHTFVGANTVMMDLIDRHSEELGATSADFGPAIAGARDNLAGAAEIVLPRVEVIDGQLHAVVGVRNLTGHKLPGGYPSRRAYLHVTVTDPAGNVVFESGRMNPDGSIVGVDSDASAVAYEPHYQLITSEDQVQVYESIMANTDGNVTYTLLGAASYAKDNRLTPAGFSKAAVPDDIAVRGNAADDPDFDNGYDEIVYQIPLPAVPSEYTLTVQLNYQPLAHGYLQDLFADADMAAVARFKRMYEATPLRAERIASRTVEVDVDETGVQAVTVGDLGDDGRADIVLRQVNSGQLYLWEMDGSSYTGSNIGALDLAWELAGIADLGGDRKSDLVLRHADSGQLYLWEMDGSEITPSNIGALNPAWQVVGLGDFGGDGKSDILLRHSGTGQLYLWEMDGATRTASNIGGLSLDWQVAAVGDLCGDGRADILLRHGETGQLYLFEMDGNVRTPSNIGALDPIWAVAGLGDFGGDGKTDILLRHSVSGQLYLFEMDGNAKTPSNIGALDPIWEIVQIGDFGGDGMADILLRHGDSGRLQLWEMQASQATPSDVAALNPVWEVQ
jgi:hypothetical protein